MTASATVTLHSGDDYVLHHHRGRGKYLLVTFMHSHREHEADTEYLLRTFAEQHELPCLGITCRTRHFYNSPEIEQVLAAAAPIVAGFETVVVVGNSIGGYGALKYSRRLRATHVLAVAAPWSLDLDALQYDDHEQRDRLKNDLLSHEVSPASLSGMGIRQEDVSGRIMVVYNPLDKIDSHQMANMRRVLDLQETFVLQQAGHNIFHMMERANIIARIIDLLRFADSADLRAEFRSFRRSTPDCIVPMLQQAVPRHPMLVHRALRGRQITAVPKLSVLEIGRISSCAAYHLSRKGHTALARERIERLAQRSLGNGALVTVGRQSGDDALMAPDRHCLLLSQHGTFLCATVGNAPRLAFTADPFASEELTPVFATLRDDAVVLQTMTPDGVGSAPLTMQGELSWTLDHDAYGCVALHTKQGFLMATWDDNVLQGPPANGWESLLPVGAPDPKTLVRPRVTNWFEMSAGRGVAVAATSPARPARGLGALLGRLGRRARS